LTGKCYNFNRNCAT